MLTKPEAKKAKPNTHPGQQKSLLTQNLEANPIPAGHLKAPLTSR